MLNAARVLCVLVLAGYAALVWTDYHVASHGRAEIPESVRASPGGWSFWHSGEHGGK